MSLHPRPIDRWSLAACTVPWRCVAHPTLILTLALTLTLTLTLTPTLPLALPDPYPTPNCTEGVWRALPGAAHRWASLRATPGESDSR